MGEDREPRRVYAPGDVAERLGISGQRLRQLARSYEGVRGELPRDGRGARVWPEGAVEDLERARELVRDGRAAGIEQALRGELALEGTGAQPATRGPGAGDISAVAGLAGELRALREAIEEQNRIMESMAGRLEDLERENRELREAIAPVQSVGPAAAEPPLERGDEIAGEASRAGTVPVLPARAWGPHPTPRTPVGTLWRLVGRLLGRREG